MVTLLRILICQLCSVILLALFKFFHKFWWVPMRIKYLMSSQGISGPPYSFIYGNNKEISIMTKRSTSLPMDKSHYIFPRIQPHIDSWLNIYGKNVLYWQGPRAELVVTEPELLKEIMSIKEISMQKQDVAPIFKKVLGEGLASSHGDKWVKQRKVATHAFHGERLKASASVLYSHIGLLFQENDKQERQMANVIRMGPQIRKRIFFKQKMLESLSILSHAGLISSRDSSYARIVLILYYQMVTFSGVMIGILCCTVVLSLFKFFHKFWWVPMRIKYLMRSQGINGPPYTFIHGNTKEVFVMIKRSMSLPMDISHHIFPRIQPHIESWFHLYGKTFLYWQGPQADLVVTKPELLKEIMSDRDISIWKPDPPPFLKKILGDGLISSKGEKWEKGRKLANYAFHGERLKNMIPAIVESVEMMLKRWEDNGTKEIEVYEEFRIMTSEVISRTAFGSSYEEGKQVFEKLGALTLLVAKNTYIFRLPGFGKIFRNQDDVESDKLQAEIDDLIIQMIRSREKTSILGDVDNSRTDYLGLLLKTHHDIHENYKLSIQDIIDDCKTFYAAGHGTASLLLSWVTLLLGIHNEWQEKARQEVQQVFGKQNPSSEGIARLKTIGMIISETLRLYPPVCSIYRKVPREMEVGNLIFPADINLQIPALALHQDPGIWGGDAHLFKPERFSNGIAKVIDNNPGAFLPFGYGPRICVGSSFATNEAKITLSMILQRYRFILSPNYVHEPVYHVTLRPKSGVQITFQAL